MPPRSMRPDRVVLAQQEKKARPTRFGGQSQAISRRGRATAETMSHAAARTASVCGCCPQYAVGVLRGWAGVDGGGHKRTEWAE